MQWLTIKTVSLIMLILKESCTLYLFFFVELAHRLRYQLTFILGTVTQRYVGDDQT